MVCRYFFPLCILPKRMESLGNLLHSQTLTAFHRDTWVIFVTAVSICCCSPPPPLKRLPEIGKMVCPQPRMPGYLTPIRETTTVRFTTPAPPSLTSSPPIPPPSTCPPSAPPVQYLPSVTSLSSDDPDTTPGCWDLVPASDSNSRRHKVLPS